MRAIVNGTLLTPTGCLENQALVYDSRIVDICSYSGLTSYHVEEIIDAAGGIVSPGLIDTHVHGAGGADTMDGSRQALETISHQLASAGVTAFLPTTMTLDWSDIAQALIQVRLAQEYPLPGAQVLGAHLEGPFLNPECCGAQAPEYMRLPDFPLLIPYLDVIRIITYAPELDPEGQFLAALTRTRQIIPSIGHSAASYELAQEAFRQGVSHVTHVFNAMSGLHHRHPGLLGAILTNAVSVELIADNLHVHPAMYQLLLLTNGLGRIVLVSDSLPVAGLPDGEYAFGGQQISVHSGVARLKNGSLAGSTAGLNRCVWNFAAATGLPLWQAMQTATQNPASLLSLEQKGSLNIGKDADIVIFDEDGEVRLTIVAGKTVYQVGGTR